ncbi:hypothetical protein [Paenibacillus tundrae]|uniref:hypothetical protein n=1 Tax=Paenibacillus tundrae TaxID=528187 RepID=UPI0030CB7902
MNLPSNSNQEKRSDSQLNLLYRAQEMIPTKPPEPWRNEVVIQAAGCIACGWNSDENLVLISSSGYSLNDSDTGLTIHRDRDANNTYDSMSPDQLTFRIPYNDECISIFGFDSGDGNHVTHDGWSVEVIYPWWPLASVIIENVFHPNYNYLESATMIDLNRLDGSVKCGFSPSGNKLVILGSGGALIYTRE